MFLTLLQHDLKISNPKKFSKNLMILLQSFAKRRLAHARRCLSPQRIIHRYRGSPECRYDTKDTTRTASRCVVR